MKNTVNGFGLVARSRWLFAGLLLFLSTWSGAVLASQGKLVILTSFPQEMTEPLRRAFLKEHPDISIEIQRRGDSDAVKLIHGMEGSPTVDLYWSAVPDGFELLKQGGYLQRYKSAVDAVPAYLGTMPISDPDGYYTGFSVSGYGFMRNIRYLDAKRLPEPRDWSALADPVYFGHVGMTSAFRSGPTHLVIEHILQSRGWEAGWRLIQRVGGNLKTVTRTGYDVAEGVRDGEFGIGVVIDSYAISAKASAYPVAFRYPGELVMLPASIALLKNAPNPAAARLFVDFLLSETAQYLLLDKRIARLPIKPEVYDSAADDFPNPFKAAIINRSVPFDLSTSIKRYALVNSLFDVMVTFNLASLRRVTSLLHAVETRLAIDDDAKARALLQQARDEIEFVPVLEQKSRDSAFVAQFSQARADTDDAIRQRGIALENQWTDLFHERYHKAYLLAEKALSVLVADAKKGRQFVSAQSGK